ncbi:MAG: hydrogenase maturation nickel metallochaperone HypA [Fimbriimonadaceae bacterium]|nr:hydrogenase maturation nickel metallochaperone HypA [Fimbriimonadaceae bacterium]
MHEVSLAEQLIGPVLAAAAQYGGERVTAVTVRAGALQQIVPGSLALAFEAVALGTLAEGATLTVETVPVTARCRRCDAEFEVEAFCFLCPTCGVADVATLTGNELLLASLELEPCESTSSTTSPS